MVSSLELSRGLDERRLGVLTSEDSVGKQKPLKVEHVEHIGAFSADRLETKYGFVRFEQGNGRYGFDLELRNGTTRRLLLMPSINSWLRVI